MVSSQIMSSHACTLHQPCKPVTNAFQKVFLDVMQGTVPAFKESNQTGFMCEEIEITKEKLEIKLKIE
jgi:hypothetical protein